MLSDIRWRRGNRPRVLCLHASIFAIRWTRYGQLHPDRLGRAVQARCTDLYPPSTCLRFCAAKRRVTCCRGRQLRARRSLGRPPPVDLPVIWMPGVPSALSRQLVGSVVGVVLQLDLGPTSAALALAISVRAEGLLGRLRTNQEFLAARGTDRLGHGNSDTLGTGPAAPYGEGLAQGLRRASACLLVHKVRTLRRASLVDCQRKRIESIGNSKD